MGKQWKQSDLIFWGSKITADGYCSHEIKRHLLLGRKVMTNLESVFKSRDITLPTKSGWTPGVGDGQGGLVCFDSWGCEESDTTELN